MIDASLVDWSRAQFALTAMYHWLFVPLTLGLGVLVALMESLSLLRGSEFWRQIARFWAKLFVINFAVGVATGIILEFEFGTNWSNYSWFVGDIFGAPLAIEGIVAFFMESTFLALMCFGWDKLSRRTHLMATWLTVIGATISAWWILVANAWMQHPVGMEFNPDTVRNEMCSFAAVAFQPMAVNKFMHVVSSAWVLGSLFVVGVSCWYLLRERHRDVAMHSLRVAAWFGLLAAGLCAMTGHRSGMIAAEQQPMKLAAAEGLYAGGNGADLVAVGLLKPGHDWSQAPADGQEPFLFKLSIPKGLSLLATNDREGFVPGIRELLAGGYTLPSGETALSVEEMMRRGRAAVAALADYRRARGIGDEAAMTTAREVLKRDFRYFGYGYLNKPSDVVPPVPVTFYAFHLMVTLGGYFIALFAGVLLLDRWLPRCKPVLLAAVLTIPLAWLASEAGWVVAEVGRQPWTVQDLLPNSAAISALSPASVQLTFFLFLGLFTLLLIAEIGIMLRAIAQGPEA